MKKIAYVVALGLAAAAAHANEAPVQPLFSIASDAVSADAPQKLTVQAAPAQSVTDKALVKGAAAKSEAAKAVANPSAAPLFNVSTDAQSVSENDKLVVKETAAAKTAAPAKTESAAKPAVKQDKRESIVLQPDSRTVAAQEGGAPDKAHEETALFKIASYYEADEMGEDDDAVRKIDFSKPLDEQLPGVAAGKKAAVKADKTVKAEKQAQAERAIIGSKAIQMAQAAPKRKKQKGSYSYVVRGKRYQTLASSENFVEEGPASWYGPGFHGRKTASGEIYDMHMLTAAHKELPLGTKLEVTSKRNGKKVVVTVNDRGPFHGNRILDLSHAAAKQLGLVHAGVGEVTIRAIK